MKINFTKIAIVGVALATFVTFAKAENKSNNSIQPVQQIDLQKYLGQWYEVARKPLYFQKVCDHNVTANYSLKENGNIKVDNRCFDKNDKLKQSIGEAYVKNAPQNSILKVSFLPSAIRWIPIGRGDYWILKIDENYQTALVGSPNKKYLWVLSRDAHPDQSIVNEYLDYAKSLGYNLGDLITTTQK